MPRSRLAKCSNILLTPVRTGSGKTLLAQTLALILEDTFTMAPIATTLDEAGYVGEDVENIHSFKLCRRLITTSRRAQRGIVYHRRDRQDLPASPTNPRSNHAGTSRVKVFGSRPCSSLMEATVELGSAPGRDASIRSREFLFRWTPPTFLFFICGRSLCAGLDKIIFEPRARGNTSIPARQRQVLRAPD